MTEQFVLGASHQITLATPLAGDEVLVAFVNGVQRDAGRRSARTGRCTANAPTGSLVVVRITKTTSQTFRTPYVFATDNDTVHAEASTLPLVIFGGQGDDTIHGGTGGDIVFGDRGRVLYFDPALVPPTTDGTAARAARGVRDDRARPRRPGRQDRRRRTARRPRDLGRHDDRRPRHDHDRHGPATSSSAASTTTRSHQPRRGATPDAGAIVLGDNGFVDWALVDRDPTDLDRVQSTDTDTGGTDTITTGRGDDVVIGGEDGERITETGSGAGVAQVTSPFGANGDTIHAGAGNDIVVGDNARSRSTSARRSPSRRPRLDRRRRHDLRRGRPGRADRRRLRRPHRRRPQRGPDPRRQRPAPAVDASTRRTRASAALGRSSTTSPACRSSAPRGRRTRTASRSGRTSGSRCSTTTWRRRRPRGTNFGDDFIAGGPGDDQIFGELGNDTIQGDGSIDARASARGRPRASRVEDFGGAGTDGRDYVEGGGGNDLIFGDLGQDDLIGGSSTLFGGLLDAERAAGRHRPDLRRRRHARPASTTRATRPRTATRTTPTRSLGDNGNVYRVVVANGHVPDVRLRHRRLPDRDRADHPARRRAARLQPDRRRELRRRPTPPHPAAFQVLPGTNTNVGGGDFLYGDAGDDVIHGQAGADTIFGAGGNDLLYGEAGGDWISGGTGDDGVLGDDGLLLPSRNGYAEPLYGVAATTQLLTGTWWQLNAVDFSDEPLSIDGDRAMRYIADLEPFCIGGNDIVYGGLGDDCAARRRGRRRDVGRRGAAALLRERPRPARRARVARGVLHARQRARLRLVTTLFRYYSQTDPFRKIMVAPEIDFLLNFISALTFDATTPQLIRDDGKDVLFGDVGNDWLVGGTNEDHLYGGYGDDLLQADDNLDSTRVDGTVTLRVAQGADRAVRAPRSPAASRTRRNLTKLLDTGRRGRANGDNARKLASIDKFQNQVRVQIDKLVNADQAATLARLVGALGNYDPLANDTPDPRATPITMADFVFGGAGRDVLIANTASDQLFDWSHDFNTYVAAFTGKGEHVIVDNPDAQTQQLLIDMALADGADQTRGGNMLPERRAVRRARPRDQRRRRLGGTERPAARPGADPQAARRRRPHGRRQRRLRGRARPGREPLEDRHAPEPQRRRRRRSCTGSRSAAAHRGRAAGAAGERRDRAPAARHRRLRRDHERRRLRHRPDVAACSTSPSRRRSRAARRCSARTSPSSAAATPATRSGSSTARRSSRTVTVALDGTWRRPSGSRSASTTCR